MIITVTSHKLCVIYYGILITYVDKQPSQLILFTFTWNALQWKTDKGVGPRGLSMTSESVVGIFVLL